MLFSFAGDLFENVVKRGRRPPVPDLGGAVSVEDQPWHVVEAVHQPTADVVRSEASGTPAGQLPERHGMVTAATDIHDPPVFAAGSHLLEQQRGEVPRMQTIPYLMSRAAEADEGQRPLVAISMEPERKDALIGLAELPRPGQHAAPVHVHGQVESGG